MGGLIAVRFSLADGRQSDLAGLIVTGAALIIDEGVHPLVRRVGRLVARLAPDLPLIPPKPGVLSTDPAVELAFLADPLTYKAPARAGLVDQMIRAGLDARARLDRLTLPLLVMHGTDDRLTSPAGSRFLRERAASPDKTLVLWPGMRHEIFNEPDGAVVVTTVLDWLDARFALDLTAGQG